MTTGLSAGRDDDDGRRAVRLSPGWSVEHAALVLLQHFRGNLDNWDPALIDALSATRDVIVFDNTGVGGSAGTTPTSIEAMARDAISFLTSIDLTEIDLLGFSIGSFVAQEIALTRPSLVRGWCWPRRPPAARRACTAGART